MGISMPIWSELKTGHLLTPLPVNLVHAQRLKLASLVHGGSQQGLESLLDFARLGVEKIGGRVFLPNSQYHAESAAQDLSSQFAVSGVTDTALESDYPRLPNCLWVPP